MPATVINGLFNSYNLNWGNAVGAGPFDGFCAVPNNTLTTQIFTGGTITGTNPGDFTLTGGQFPVSVNPGQSVLFHVTFTPGGGGSRAAQVTFNTAGTFNPVVSLTGAQTTVVTPGIAFPNTLQFPTTKVGQTSTFANVQIVNIASTLITVSNIAMGVGTDFFIIGAPVVPFTIASGASSAVFSIQFTPTVAGSRNDGLNITTSGPGGVTDSSVLTGIGSTLQSAFNLSGGAQSSLFAVSGIGGISNPLLLIAAPGNLNCEEPSSFAKLHDFALPNQEKQLMRIRGHYEDLGVATVTFTARSRRQGQPDENIQVSVQIGTVGADGWIREFTSEPVPVTGELIQITVSRAGNAGPVSLIDYMPQVEPKGEVIGAT